jgi:hypothetical protein
VHLTRGRIQLAAGQGELVFEQLHLSLQLGYLAVVLGDTTFELTV